MTTNNPPDLKAFPLTILLIAIFVGLFAWQLLTGVDANHPSSQDLIKWGANSLSLSVVEPWRWITAGFLHIGLIHLLFNGFAMYYFGQVAEQMWGRIQFLAVFILSVIGGNVLNCYLAWQAFLDNQTPAGLSAGASGGIMGIGAGLLICALFKVQIAGMQLRLGSLMMIMLFNLSYGFVATGIDNAGHIGGAMTGLILSLAFVMTWKIKSVFRSVPFWLIVLSLTFAYTWVWYDLHIATQPYL